MEQNEQSFLGSRPKLKQFLTGDKSKGALLNRGGLPGMLVGLAAGGSEEFARGMSTVQGLQANNQAMRIADNKEIRDRESHKMDMASRYKDLEMKSREIQIQDMNIQVLQAEQNSKLYNAHTASERAKNIYNNIGFMQTADTNALMSTAIGSQMKLDDQAFTAVARYADAVTNEEGHKRAYSDLEEIAKSVGSSVDSMFPGITKEWRGEDTKKAYTAAKYMATSTKELLAEERINTQKAGITADRDATIQGYDIQNKRTQFEYDKHLLQMKLDAQREQALMAALAKQKGASFKRSDLETTSYKDIAGSISLSLSGMLGESLGKDGPKENIILLADRAANMVSSKVDQAWMDYATGKRNTFLTQAAAKTQVLNELQGHIGTDNKFYENPKDPKLLRQKEEWIQSYMDQNRVGPNAEEFNSFPEEVQRLYAEAAFADVEKRRIIESR